jgi:hypothetical protein
MRKLLTALPIATFVLAMPTITQAELPEQIASVAPAAKRALDVRSLKTSEKSGRVSVTLPDGKVLRFVPLTVRERQGVTTVRGAADGARLLLTTDGHNAFGFIATANANYRITTVGNDTYVIDFAALPPADGVSMSLDDVHINQEFVQQVRKHMNDARVRGKVAAEAAEAPFSVIDIAMFIDPALLDIYSAQALRTMTQARIDYTNEAFITNHIGVELNLVLVEMYTPLTSGTARMDPYPAFSGDTANAARAAAFGADLRHLLYFQRAGIPYCGKAGLVESSGVSGAQCAESTVAHELGHNFGAHHDRPHADGNVDLPISAYNYGLPCGGDATLMSYVGAAPLGYYSDPAHFNKGEACGVAFDQPSGAHNAHVIEEMRTVLESFQAPQVTYGTVSLPTGPVVMNEWDAPRDITVTRDGDLTHATSVEIASIEDSANAERDYVPVLTRLEFAEGETSKVVRIEPIDDADDYEEDQSFRLVLRYPLGLTVAGSPMTVTLHSDDPDLGKAVLATDSISAQENEGPVSLVINRIGDSTGTLVIQYLTADGTCVAGECYEAVSGSVTFAPGETTKSVQVPIVDNDRREADEFRSFTFALQGSNLGESAGAITTTTVKVFNDDPDRGVAQFVTLNTSAGESTGPARLTVMRTGNTEHELRINYATTDGTARAGQDYTAASGTLTFAPGEISHTIEVAVIDNAAVDGPRDLSVIITGDVVETLSTMSITINDNDKQQKSGGDSGGGGGGGGMEAASLLTLAMLIMGRRRTRRRAARATSAQ